jgi:hypothetical protein
MSCWVCGDGPRRTRAGQLLHQGCGCRGTAGFAHLPCLVEAAAHNPETWESCPTCLQAFSGALQLGLARSHWQEVRGFPQEDEERLVAADNYGGALQDARDYAGALPLLDEVLVVSRRVDGDDDINTCVSMCNLAALLSDMGRPREALPLLEEALATQHRTLGSEHTDSIRTAGNLAVLYMGMSDLQRSKPLMEETCSAWRRVAGEEDVDTLTAVHNLAMLNWHLAHGEFVSFADVAEYDGYCDMDRLLASAELLRESADGRRRVLGEGHSQSDLSRRCLERVQGRIAEVRQTEQAGTMYSRLAKRRRWESEGGSGRGGPGSANETYR